AVAGSLMCAKGVNLKLIREDNTDNMQAALVAFAEALKKGEANPSAGTHFVAIMGDGSATFLKGLNDKLLKLGPEYITMVVGSAGYSRGEDKFMGLPAWKENPQAAKGGLVAGMLSAIFEAGDKVKQNDESLRQAAAISALAYKEKDAAYWYKYFKVVNQKDKAGLDVELGGSSVNNLADNLQLFGMAAGST